jgi:predicted small secreted protein
MSRLRSLLCLVLAVFALSACNTVRGIGQDVKKAGEAVEDAAD